MSKDEMEKERYIIKAYELEKSLPLEKESKKRLLKEANDIVFGSKEKVSLQETRPR